MNCVAGAKCAFTDRTNRDCTKLRDVDVQKRVAPVLLFDRDDAAPKPGVRRVRDMLWSDADQRGALLSAVSSLAARRWLPSAKNKSAPSDEVTSNEVHFW